MPSGSPASISLGARITRHHAHLAPARGEQTQDIALHAVIDHGDLQRRIGNRSAASYHTAPAPARSTDKRARRIPPSRNRIRHNPAPRRCAASTRPRRRPHRSTMPIITPCERMMRVSMRVSTPAMPGMPCSRSKASSRPVARQLLWPVAQLLHHHPAHLNLPGLPVIGIDAVIADERDR